jgi:hypothetical protein
MKINEVIYFSHELDMLEAHLEEHQSFVDKFFIKESPVWWSGGTKELVFDQNRDRYRKYNIEYMLIPASEFDLSIPANFPESEFKKWFDVRRSNRQKSRYYRWGDIAKGADFILSMDTDEILDSRRIQPFLDLVAKKEHEHICFAVRQHQFWVNTPGKGVDIWRGFRGDIPYRGAVKGHPRHRIGNIGWHFTNCFIDPADLRSKAVGILTHYGYNGVDSIPNPEDLGKALASYTNPFGLRWQKGKLASTEKSIKPESFLPWDNPEWAPKFMREHPELFPWYKG